jgi:hypothetical protein
MTTIAWGATREFHEMGSEIPCNKRIDSYISRRFPGFRLKMRADFALFTTCGAIPPQQMVNALNVRRDLLQ